LSGNPLAVACGRATLELIEQPGFYETLTRAPRHSYPGWCKRRIDTDIDFCADSVGSMFGLYAAAQVPRGFAEVMRCDKERFNRFFHAMLDAGVYLAPSAFEAGFVSIQHDEAVAAKVLAAADQAFAASAR
jgi:glutamate-1-semialdehyde 2,1-aminomutase